ncbi:recombinase family protein [Rhodobacteraceae bacterium KMM 6894]|nr:recombinase family protein [Rhodobacteraceae bacterium KMM 6894]
MTQTILYVRVSTADQTIDHQLGQAMAAGFQIDDVIRDDGVSGVSTRLSDRPGGKRLFDRLRSGDVLVVRWVDRLGRDYQDVTDTIRHFMRRGVIIKTVINGMTFDGATMDPVQQAVRDALIAFLAATAQAQAEATKVSQRAGIDHARSTRGETAYRGRKPSYGRDEFNFVSALLTGGNTASQISKVTGLSRQAVLRIRDNRPAAEAALVRWNI